MLTDDWEGKWLRYIGVPGDDGGADLEDAGSSTKVL